MTMDSSTMAPPQGQHHHHHSMPPAPLEEDLETPPSPRSGQSLKGMQATKRSSKATAVPLATASQERRQQRSNAVPLRLRTKKASSANDALWIKYGSLFLLVTQMVGLVLLMRYTRTNNKSKDGELYLASTAVFWMELTKLVICMGVVFYQTGSTVSGLVIALQKNVWNAPYEMLKLCVPSLLYTVQNNLLYYALSHLDAATYQVCYQLKILTTALFSVLLLQRKFSATKWFSLVLLTVGVVIVQRSGSSSSAAAAAASTTSTSALAIEEQSRFLGLVAVLCAACTSGFSGVYFEKILKGSPTSLWLRNIQMGLPSVVIALITIGAKDYAVVSTKGFFAGYHSLVWTVILVQAAGGLIVALVVKYADNVLKVFATSFSIILSCLVSSTILHDFSPNGPFCVGASLVMISTVLYARPSSSATTARLRRKAARSSGTSSVANSKSTAPQSELPLHHKQGLTSQQQQQQQQQQPGPSTLSV